MWHCLYISKQFYVYVKSLGFWLSFIFCESMKENSFMKLISATKQNCHSYFTKFCKSMKENSFVKLILAIFFIWFGKILPPCEMQNVINFVKFWEILRYFPLISCFARYKNSSFMATLASSPASLWWSCCIMSGWYIYVAACQLCEWTCWHFPTGLIE